jgi:crotonobetainyl-CoA:carnitine CoA-transferase CaiB-like acyl-CoA transferase
VKATLVHLGGPGGSFLRRAKRVQLGRAGRTARVLRSPLCERRPPGTQRAASPAAGRHVEEIWAEQEAKNAELHTIDHSHIRRCVSPTDTRPVDLGPR